MTSSLGELRRRNVFKVAVDLAWVLRTEGDTDGALAALRGAMAAQLEQVREMERSGEIAFPETP